MDPDASKASPLRIPNLTALRASTTASELSPYGLSSSAPAVQVVSFNSSSQQAVVVPPPPAAVDKAPGVKVSLVHAAPAPSLATSSGASSLAAVYKPVTITPTPKSAPFDAGTRLMASSSTGPQPTVSVTLNPGLGMARMPLPLRAASSTASGGPILVPAPNQGSSVQLSGGAPARVIGATRIVNLSSSLPHVRPNATSLASKVVAVTNSAPSSNPSTVAPMSIPVARVIPQKPSGDAALRPNASQNLPPKTAHLPLVVNPAMQVASRLPSVEVHTVNKKSGPNHGATDLTTGSTIQMANVAANAIIPQLQQKPGILRRREGEKELTGLPPRSLSQDDIHSSGSTTLSATSSPLAENDNALMIEEAPQEPSPRKKPRKQQLLPKDVITATATTTHVAKTPVQIATSVKSTTRSSFHSVSTLKNRPASMSLMASHRPSWKSRHNHFVRRSDVVPKEEKRPTVNELAGQTRIEKKLCGWKVHHVSTQMDDIIQVEKDFMHRLAQLQRIIERKTNVGNSLLKDREKVQELIKANLQRSKVIQAQVQESKACTMKLFDHKPKVETILAKFAHRRQPRK